ncbi:hypothetical protein [Streptomyces sp. KL116D]|uniref:hypothetical protein n=1 Tax=Streptomyces sp. KL116D TaxID=3045152 RepID=UPI00355898CF
MGGTGGVESAVRAVTARSVISSGEPATSTSTPALVRTASGWSVANWESSSAVGMK